MTISRRHALAASAASAASLVAPWVRAQSFPERPITIEQGTNVLVGTDSVAITRAVDEILAGLGKRGRIPEYWDGHAAERIAADLWQLLKRGAALH